jgi:hypothetical protein
LIKAGTLLNIWLYSITDARVIASAVEWKALVLDLRLDQKIDGSGCLHSYMHCGEAQGDTMEACVHRTPKLLGCTPSVDEFRSQDFGLKLNWKHPWDRTCVFYSVSRMER